MQHLKQQADLFGISHKEAILMRMEFLVSQAEIEIQRIMKEYYNPMSYDDLSEKRKADLLTVYKSEAEKTQAKLRELRMLENKKYLELSFCFSPVEKAFKEDVINNIKKEIKKKTTTLWRLNNRINKLLGKKVEYKNQFDVEQIKRIPINLIIGGEGRATGHNRISFRCPLHNEKTPSFVWYRDQNTFSCFGCGQAGDNIKLYMLINNCDFKEACKELSNFGVY